MARPKIDYHWYEQIAVLAEQGKRSPTIRRILMDMAEQEGRDDAPSERTIRRIYKEHMARSELERREYTAFRWPEHMEVAGLPWQASRVVLDLLRYHMTHLPHRPSVKLVKWYWRVHVAAPDLERRQKAVAAGALAETEERRGGDAVADAVARAVESYLSFEPWRWIPQDEEGVPVEFAEGPKELLERLCKVNEVGAQSLFADETVRIPSLIQFIELVWIERGFKR